MDKLTSCPACNCGDLVDVGLGTNLTSEHIQLIGDTAIWQADYASCPNCELMFARNRQDETETDEYYAAFKVIEKRDYAVYPPPQKFIDAQESFSERFVGRLAEAGLINASMSVLNVRTEYGVHLARLRDVYGVQDVYGLDHFESNIEYAQKDLALKNIELLDPRVADLGFGDLKFDLILANHQLTHALEPMEILARFKNRLKPGGTVVFYNELDHMGIMDLPKTFRRGVISFHKQLLTRNSLENMLKLAGYATSFIDYDPVGIKWASGRHSMVIGGTPAKAIKPDQVSHPGSPSLYDAYEAGLAKHSRIGLLDKAKRLLSGERLSA